MITGKGLLIILSAALLRMPADACGEESLSGAMRAVKADSFAAALEISYARDSNPWLEVFRLETRAQAFLGLGDSIRAAQRAFSALRLISSGQAEGHPEEDHLIDLAAMCGGPELAFPFVTDDNSSRLRPRTLLLLARISLESGDTSGAAGYISLAAERRPGACEVVLLREMAAMGALDLPEVSRETVASLATSAISARDLETSRLLIDLVRSTAQYTWLADILDADLSVASGRGAKAIARYRSVFHAEEYPVEGKKLALQKLADLQYRMKRYRDALESYRTFRLYFPDDPFAEISTDWSARIDAAAGRLKAAAETWRMISDKGAVTSAGREALLAMAAVLEKLGRKDEAYSILVENLPRADGRLRAAYLYWIVRTCGDERLRSDHALSLRGEAAGSFYARAIEDGSGFLNADEERDIVPRISLLETETRNTAFPAAGPPVDLPSLEAFRYFAAEKMKSEASDCARSYLAALGSDERGSSIPTLYNEARAAGLENLCLELAAADPGLFPGMKDHLKYLYPFTFGSEIDRGSKERNLPPELVLAVIREESRFDEEIISPAGACGLMQIMPSTGEWIGKKIGRKHIVMQDLRDPGFNIEAGCWYLRFLLDRSDESIVAALAAYNAGHGRMESWKKRYRPHDDPLAALELIGPSETRQYVRRVLESMATYTRLAAGVRE
jgi:soluble lytic murein transglycosylase